MNVGGGGLAPLRFLDGAAQQREQQQPPARSLSAAFGRFRGDVVVGVGGHGLVGLPSAPEPASAPFVWRTVMAITEETRHHRYQRLEEALGPEEATTLMEHLPPVGWADVVTRHDLEHLEQRMDQRFELLELRLDERLSSGLASLEVRLLSAFSAFRDESRAESVAFREGWHAEQRANQRQIIVLLMVALISVVAAVIGLR
jgi:hypothetical protein